MGRSEPTTSVNGLPLVLTEVIGTGNDRECWRHPLNRSLCVKVAKPEQERTQNEIDYHYGRHLARHSVAGRYLPRVHGWVETNRGRGLVVDLVQQPDGPPSPTLRIAQIGRAACRERVCQDV